MKSKMVPTKPKRKYSVLIDENNNSNASNAMRNFITTDPIDSQNILKKMLGNKQFCDVTLKSGIDSVCVSAHRSVLAVTSDYFAAMFRLDMREKNKEVIVINGVSGAILKSLVAFCYTEAFQLNWENVFNVLEGASLLNFIRIENECKRFLEQQFDCGRGEPQKCFNILTMAEKYGFQELAVKSQQRIRDNFCVITKTGEFYDVEFAILQRVLSSSEPFNAKEEDIYEAAMAWVNYNLAERKVFIPRVLKLIRLTQLNYTYLTEHVRPVCIANNCMDLLADSVLWRNLSNKEQKQFLKDVEGAGRALPLEILVFGGDDVTGKYSIESYCFLSKKWTIRSRIAIGGITGGHFTNFNDCVYITGGKVSTSGYGSRNAHFGCFNLKTRTFSQLISMNLSRIEHNAAIIDNRLYIIGGINTTNRLKSIDSVHCFNLIKGEWTKRKSMQCKRGYLGAAVLNGHLYAIGGYCHTNGYLNSVERYHPLQDTWTFVSPMIQSRANPGVAVLREKIYVIGGYCSKYFDTVEVLDPIKMEWSMIASLSVARSSMAIAVHENSIFAINGAESVRESTIVEQYIEDEDKWIQLAPCNLSSHASIAIISRL